MKTRSVVKRLWIVMALVACVGLWGCEGDDGDRGPQGPEGPTGPPGPGITEQAADIALLDAEITGVTIQSPPVVTFTVNGIDGEPLTDLGQEDVDNRSLRFGIAKLIPGTNGNEDDWQSYINTTEVAEEGEPRADGIPAGNTTVQATTENGGTLENLGGGEYRYTFATDVANVTDPVAVPYEPNLLHRVAIQMEFSTESGGEEKLQVANPTFDFVPAGGTPPATRDIVDTSSCNECHDLLALHGGARVKVEYCVMCHNPGTTDANSGNTVNFKVMIHKIHYGRELPSVQAFEASDGAQGKQYIIFGFGNSEHNYSNLGFPGDVRNCTKCHNPADVDDEGEPLTPDAEQWKTMPTIQACTSCHDNIFINADVQGPKEAFQIDHPGGTGLTNESCTACHPAEGAGFGMSVTDAHTIHDQVAAQSFQYNIESTAFDQTTGDLDVTVSVSDPGTGTNYDLLNDPEFTATDTGVSRLALLVGWNPNFDFHNTFSGNEAAQPISINLLDSTVVTPNDTANGPTFTVTANVPEGVDSVRIAIEGHPATADPDTGEFTVRAPVTSATEDVSLTGGDTPERREVVDIDKCLVCHNFLSLHGGNRTNNLGICVICHNPNATDVSQVPGVDDPATPDINEGAQNSIDFKRMIHAIHASGMRQNHFVVFGFGGSPHDFSEESTTGDAVFFPGHLENCKKCHVDESFNVPLNDAVLASTTDVDGTQSPLDDINITPTAAVCSACHDGQAAVAHMMQNGGDFNFVTGDFLATADPNEGDNAETSETCVICHAPGRIAPVGEVHFLEEVSVPAPEPPVPGGGGEQPGAVTANAGPDQTIAATGTPVQLDASGSTGTNLTYNWTLTDPASADATDMLSATNVANPTFTPDTAGVWTATVDVSDGTTTDTDTVNITVGAAPAGVTANAGADQTIAATGTPVQLDASGSTGTNLTYNWTLTDPSSADATVLLSATNIANPTFTPNAEGAWTATVEVSDGTNTDTDSATITVGAAAPDGQALFVSNCGACHNANGAGTGGINISTATAQEITDKVTADSGVTHAGGKFVFTAEELQAIIDFITGA